MSEGPKNGKRTRQHIFSHLSDKADSRELLMKKNIMNQVVSAADINTPTHFIAKSFPTNWPSYSYSVVSGFAINKFS